MDGEAIGTKQETADDYAKVVARLDERHRIIVCRDNLQWILQRRDRRTGTRPWASLRYCQTREALIRDCRHFCKRIDPNALAVLEALPDHIRHGGGNGA